MCKQSAIEDSIKHCIKKSGFPDKNVRLPFKAIHDSCKNHGSTLKTVLANLAQDKIIGTVQGNFIEFSSANKPRPKPKAFNEENHSPQTGLPNMEKFKEMAQGYMSKMNPDQIKNLKDTIENMDEEERNNIIKKFSQQFFKDKL